MSVNIFNKSTGSVAQIAGNATSGGGTTVTVDNILSATSENPVQNKVITEELNKKADQTTVDSALSLKANSADVTASLAGKSDIGHTHDDRYYTESETNTLLGDKVGVSDFNSHTNNTTVHVTAEEKASWNAVNYSNPNLLVNPDFKINQRGLASYSSSEYTVDRWKIGNAKLTVNDGFITLENTTEKATANIYQFFENPAVLSGKTVTLSFDYDLKTEGAWISVQAVTNGSWIPSPPVRLTDTGRNVKSTVITLPENLTDLRLALVIHSTDSAPFAIVDIYGAKLELGKISTPIIPAEPATELAKCQRFYQVRTTNDIDPLDLRPSMRTITDIKAVEGGYAYVAEL